MAISFTLWVFNHVEISSEKQDEISVALDSLYLQRCRSRSVTSTATRWAAPDERISPAPFDAVVFLVKNPFGSLAKIAGADMTRAKLNDEITGTTTIGAAGGPVAEVYWDRCARLFNVPDAIFHEAAHAKSGQDEPMHDTPGVRTLSRKGSLTGHPSDADIAFFSRAILRPIGLRRSTPV